MEIVKERPSRLITHRPYARENARKATKFEGKRYLGTTANGRDVWINFKIERDSTLPNAKKTVKIWSTVDLDLLLEEGAELANTRISFGTGVPQRGSISSMNRDTYVSHNRKHGAVSPRTLEYIEEIIRRCPEVNPKRMEFFDVANAIFVGTTDECNIGTRNTFTLSDLLATWNLRPNYE